MDPWSKVDYSRIIREASMVVEKLPEVVPPSGRVPGRGLLVLPILEVRWRRNRGETAKKGSFLEGFGMRGIYRRRGPARGGPGAAGAPWRGLGRGHARWPPRWCGPSLAPPFGLYLLLVPETLGTEPFLRYLRLFRCRHDSKIRRARRTCPGTLSEGGLTSGSFSTTMRVSRMCRE